MTALDQVLAVLLLALYIAGVVALAAGITFAVIRVFPTERNPKKSDKPEKDEKPKAQAADGSPGAGALFRRSKRGEK